MSNKAYDNLKFFALLFFPLLTTFVGVVLETLEVPAAGAILTIMSAFGAFLGGTVKAASDYYGRLTPKAEEGAQSNGSQR